MRSSFASKSLFSNAMMGFEGRSMINPVSGSYPGRPMGAGTGTGGGGGGGNTTTITTAELEALYDIQRLYTAHLANRTYEQIPVDYSQYLELRLVAETARIKYSVTQPSLSLLFQITVDGITGALNAFGLNNLYIDTSVQNTYLQGVLEEIINGVNVNKAFDQNTSTIHMSRSFELAPLFRYYIALYGVPDPGVGFDPTKLALVLKALEHNGIDPYA